MAGLADLWATLPIKPLAEGKSRLNLPLSERIKWNRLFFGKALATLIRTLNAERIVVVSRDPEVLAASERAGARALPEKVGDELNGSLTASAILAARLGARAVLSIACDLPSLLPEDIAEMATAHAKRGGIVIAPDTARVGTNAMLMSPLAIPYGYGSNSFRVHLEAARAGGHAFTTMRRPGLAEDVDWPDDLARAIARGTIARR